MRFLRVRAGDRAHRLLVEAAVLHTKANLSLINGHLFPDDMDRLAERLDATRRAASAEIPAASSRPGHDETVVDIEKGKQKREADQRLRK